MSLIRQLWLGVMLIALIALSGSFVINIWSARQYLQDQLYLKNQDNAASLALLLSQQPYDPVSVELFIAAQFDSGHYSSIRFRNPAGLTIAERHQEHRVMDVPQWFQRQVKLEVDPGKAQVTQGWHPTGSITVESDSRFAYISLWKGCTDLAIAYAFGAGITGLLGSLWLRSIRKPLRAVVNQAEAIQERRFVTIKEPSISELGSVARAMNVTVQRLQSMFAEEAARLESLRQEANQDALTGLPNRSCFLAELELALHSPQEARQGAVLLLRVHGLTEMNQRLGHDAVDRVLLGLTQGLKFLASEYEGLILGRLNGSDFAVLAPESALPGLANVLFETGQAALDLWNAAGAGLGVGWATYTPQHTCSMVLAEVDNALARAEAQSVAIAEFSNASPVFALPRSSNDWHQFFDQALAQGQFRLEYFPVLGKDGACLHYESALRLLPAPGVSLSAADFMPMACRLGRSDDLDFWAIDRALTDSVEQKRAVSVNVDGASIAHPGFVQRVEQRLQTHPAALADVWLEVSEVSALKHLDAFTEWCQRLTVLDVRLGIEHFGDQLSAITQLHGLGIAYIKIDGRFIQHLRERMGNQNFLRGLIGMGHGMGAVVIAEGVQAESEWELIGALGFDGATGPGVVLK